MGKSNGAVPRRVRSGGGAGWLCRRQRSAWGSLPEVGIRRRARGESDARAWCLLARVGEAPVPDAHRRGLYLGEEPRAHRRSSPPRGMSAVIGSVTGIISSAMTKSSKGLMRCGEISDQRISKNPEMRDLRSRTHPVAIHVRAAAALSFREQNTTKRIHLSIFRKYLFWSHRRCLLGLRTSGKDDHGPAVPPPALQFSPAVAPTSRCYPCRRLSWPGRSVPSTGRATFHGNSAQARG
jgi:hypothetical protein